MTALELPLGSGVAVLAVSLCIRILTSWQSHGVSLQPVCGILQDVQASALLTLLLILFPTSTHPWLCAMAFVLLVGDFALQMAAGVRVHMGFVRFVLSGGHDARPSGEPAAHGGLIEMLTKSFHVLIKNLQMLPADALLAAAALVPASIVLFRLVRWRRPLTRNGLLSLAASLASALLLDRPCCSSQVTCGEVMELAQAPNTLSVLLHDSWVHMRGVTKADAASALQGAALAHVALALKAADAENRTARSARVPTARSSRLARHRAANARQRVTEDTAHGDLHGARSAASTADSTRRRRRSGREAHRGQQQPPFQQRPDALAKPSRPATSNVVLITLESVGATYVDLYNAVCREDSLPCTSRRLLNPFDRRLNACTTGRVDDALLERSLPQHERGWARIPR